jgi:glucose uptake protein
MHWLCGAGIADAAGGHLNAGSPQCGITKNALSPAKHSIVAGKKLMVGILYAFITVFAWGTWIAPSQNVQFKNQQIKTLYVAAANLVLAFFVTLGQGFGQITPQVFWMPFVGGLIWAVSGLCAFTATHKIGMARAFGIWAPLNIIVSLMWGAALFHEFPDTGVLNKFLLFASVATIILGVLMIILSKGGSEKSQDQRTLWIGVSGSVGAGILWGSYFIPIKLSAVSVWIATFPLAVGMFMGSILLALIARQSPRLASSFDYLRVCLTGVLWGVGNYAMLLLVGQLGAGRGFTISQLSVVVGALIGIYWLKDPKPKTRAATLTLIGCVLATVGGIVLGNLN